ncbi:hypothetical protein I4U23_011682 [Adineta vaga]|nr:hypothetical protein I4U23_011682 [Adineta vaga]
MPFVFESYWDRFTDIGRRVSQDMATYWTNFAKIQNPNEPSRAPLSWPKVTGVNEPYMYIQDPFQIGENYLKSFCEFWDEIGYKNFIA